MRRRPEARWRCSSGPRSSWGCCSPLRAVVRHGSSPIDELEDAQALAQGRRALGELRELARLEPGLAPSSGLELADALSLIELPGPAPEPGTVAVLDPLGLRARRVRALFLCGLQEGVFPARSRPEPLLSEEERGRLAELTGLRLGSAGDRLAAERHLFYAVLSRPEEFLALSWHVADDEAEPTSRSLFVEDLCDLFAEGLMERRQRRALGAVEGPVAAPLLAGFRSGPEPLSDERLLASLRERVWSASSLERWLGCPVKWYVESVLKPGELEPEAEPLAQGGWPTRSSTTRSRGCAARRASAVWTPLACRWRGSCSTRRWSATAGPLAVGLPRAQGRDLHPSAQRSGALPDLRGRARRDARAGPPRAGVRLRRARRAWRGSTLRALELGEGFRMRGRIDRVDQSPAGEAVLVDYKSGRVSPVKRWEQEGKLQLPLYMLAVEQLLGLPAVAGIYQPLSGSLQARGVIDADARARNRRGAHGRARA